MILGDMSHHKYILKIDVSKIEASDGVSLLGITIDKKLTFKQHIQYQHIPTKSLLESAV